MRSSSFGEVKGWWTESHRLFSASHSTSGKSTIQQNLRIDGSRNLQRSPISSRRRDRTLQPSEYSSATKHSKSPASASDDSKIASNSVGFRNFEIPPRAASPFALTNAP